MNFQIVSAREGVRAAVRSGCEFILKQRSDQRIYRCHPDIFLWSLSRSVPTSNLAIKSRMVINDVYTRVFWPLHPTDHISFGHAADMIDYWDCPIAADQSGAWPGWHDPAAAILDLLRDGWNVESRLFANFLKKRGIEREFTLDEWWRLIAEMFVIVDNATLDLFWPKYDFYTERRFVDAYDLHPQQLLSFGDWLLLKSGIRPPDKYTHLLGKNLVSIPVEKFRDLTN